MCAHLSRGRRPRVRVLGAVLAAILLGGGCSADSGDTKQEGKDSGGFSAAAASFKKAIVAPISTWANDTVSSTFNDLTAAKTRQAEEALTGRVAQSDSTKNLASFLCEQLKSIEAVAKAGPEDLRQQRIDAAIKYSRLTDKIHTAAAILRRIFTAEPAQRDQLLRELVSTDPADPNKTKVALDSLRKVGLLSPTDEVLAPDADDQRMQFDLGGDVPGFDTVTSYYGAPLDDLVNPCFPGYKPG